MCGEGTKIAFKFEVYHMEKGFIMDFDIEDTSLQGSVGQIDGIIVLFIYIILGYYQLIALFHFYQCLINY